VVEHKADEVIQLAAVYPHPIESASIQTAIVVEVPEEATRIAMLKAGEADHIQFGLANLGSVQSIPGIRTFTRPSSGRTSVALNYSGMYCMTEWKGEKLSPVRTRRDNLPWVPAVTCDDPDPKAAVYQSEEWLKAVKVRKAISMSIDRQGIVDEFLMGLGDPAYYWNKSPGHSRWTAADQKKYEVPYDTAAAKALLAEAGYPDGFEYKHFCPQGWGGSTIADICMSLVPMFADIGVKASEINKTVYSVMRPRMVGRDMEYLWNFAARCFVENLINFRWGPTTTWNPGGEVAVAAAFMEKILASKSNEEGWNTIQNELIPWMQDVEIKSCIASWAAPAVMGPRVMDWPANGTPTSNPNSMTRIKLRSN
jgi:ABC-type transport system substrate-binding protein